MTTLLMSVQIWSLITQIGKVTVHGQYHCIWQIVTQGQTRKGGVQKEMSDQCLTMEQAKQIYDKIETGEMVKLRRLDRQHVQNVL